MMHFFRLLKWLPVLLCTGQFLLASAEFSPQIRTNRYTDEFLYHMSAKYSIALPQNFFSQPMNVVDINNVLLVIDSLDHQGLLSKAESSQLKNVDVYINGKHSIFTWKDAKRDLASKLRLTLPGEVNVKYNDSTSVFIKGLANPRLEGNISKLSYYAEMDVWTDYRSDTIYPMSFYQPYDGVPYNLYGHAQSSHARSSDLPRGGIYLDASPLKIMTGIDYLRQGPCIYNPLMFSGEAPPELFGRLWLDLGIARYTHTAGMLKSQKDKDKFFYTHRLEFNLWKNRLNLGLNEAIANGSTTDQPGDSVRKEYRGIVRTWEWTYLIPFVPFKFVEHYNGDRDNALISLDGNLNWPTSFRWYGELLIDDLLSPWQFWTNYMGNKWAYTLGMQWFGCIQKKEITAGCEYTHIEPWVYTHFYGGSHRWDTYNTPLGSQLGPDAEQLHLDGTIAVTDQIIAGLSFVYTGKNSSARGGNITDIFQDSVSASQPGDRTTKTFLGTGTKRSVCTSITARYNPLGRFWLNGELGYDTQYGIVLQGKGALEF